jgi:hypothetical protein
MCIAIHGHAIIIKTNYYVCIRYRSKFIYDNLRFDFVARCGNLAAMLKNQSTLTMEYDHPALEVEGVSITFACSPGLMLSGPNASTCMGNGKWEPDPRDVECESKLLLPVLLL